MKPIDLSDKSAAFMAALAGTASWGPLPHARDVYLRLYFAAAVHGVWTRAPGLSYN